MWTDALLILSLIFFAVCFCWYSLVGKTPKPPTAEEVNTMWSMHKKQTGCTGSRIKDLLMNKTENLGFKCECGYELKQQRSLTQTIRKPYASVEFSDQTGFRNQETIGKE